MGFLEGFCVDYGGVKIAGLDWRIRLVPNMSSGSGRETGVSAQLFFPCRRLNCKLGIVKAADTRHVRAIWL